MANRAQVEREKEKKKISGSAQAANAAALAWENDKKTAKVSSYSAPSVSDGITAQKDPTENTKSSPASETTGFWQRVFKTASGGVKHSASQYSDAARAQYEASQGGRTQRTMDELRDIEWAVANAKYAYDTAQDVGAKQSSQNALNANLAKLKAYAEVLGDGAYDVVLREAYDTADKLGSGDAKSLYAGLAGFDPDAFNGVQQQATAATAQMADQLQQSAGTDIAQAKQGLGAVGQTLVDAGVAGTQMLGDAAANLIAPGMSKVAMAQRVFGGGTQEARQHGANLAQQMGYGAANAALELLTESMFDGLAGIYGGGAADDVVEAFVQKTTGNPAGRAALRVLAGAAGEGAEELVSGIVNPFLQTIYNSDALRESYGKGNLKETVSGLLYDALIGTILGTVGGGANAVKRYGTDAKASAAPDGAALGAEATANGESATTATPAEERAAEAIVEGERTAAAEQPADPLLAAIINTQQQKTAASEETTVVDTNPEHHTAAEQKVIDEYQAAADHSVLSFLQRWRGLKNPDYKRRISLPVGDVTQRAVDDLQRLVNVDVSGFVHSLSGNALQHIELRHGANGAADQSMADDNDVARVGHVLERYDSVDIVRESDGSMKRSSDVRSADGSRAPMVRFEKKVNGTFYVVEAVPDSAAKKLRIVSMYMQKNSGNNDQVLNMPSSDDPQPTPEVPVGAIAPAYSDSTLTHEEKDVKKAPDAESSVGAAEHGFDPFTAAQNEHGTLPSGEHPVRPDDVPVSTDGTDRVSQSVVTAKGARVTPDEFVPLIENETMKGRFSFIPITNDATVQAVEDVIMRDGWEKALTDWTADVRKGKAGAQITAMGAMLYNNAVNAGQEQTALDILTDYQMAVRNTARGLQASRIMKKLTPESRLYMMERSIQNMVDDLGLDEPITLPQELVDAYTNAEDEAAADKVVDEIQQYVADQIPPTIMDKWTALRYTNMLGNFKTQVRNVAGNVGMAVVTEMKNAIAAGLETLAQGKAGRAHAILPGKALMDAARADFRTQQDEVMAGQRYADSMSEDAFARGVQEKQRIFKNPVLEGYRKATNWAMNNEHFGDAAFSRRAYARALAGYLKANNVTAEQFTDAKWQAKHGKFLDKARSFAAHEAQEATFRDHNVLSDWVSRIGRRADTPRAVRAVAEGLLPFRRTPANILVRAAEYSPLGIVKNAVDVARKAKGADISGVDIINGIAKTLTGTGIFALGMLLRNAGMLRGGDDEDEEQAAFDDLTGHQPYSLELEDGTSITLDWLTPASMPLFMGVELMDLIQDEGLEVKDLEQALTSIADPMLQMSMLQGISDTLGDLQYSQSNNLGQTVITAALGYLTQGLTNSLVGQLERTVDGGNDMTYVDPESALPAWLQREIGAASRKVPGLDYNQIPYIDAWGREEETGDVLERAAHNLFNPAYVSQVDVDKLESELQRLYDATGDVAVLPDRAAKSFTMDGETRYLTAEEYVQFAKASGQDSYRYASEAVQSAAYRSMSDEERSELIGKLYSYAKYKAKKGIEPKYESDTYRKAAEAEKNGISPVEYYTGRMRSDADGNGTTSKAEAQNYLDSQSGLSNAKKVDLWDIICTTGAKNPYQ